MEKLLMEPLGIAITHVTGLLVFGYWRRHNYSSFRVLGASCGQNDTCLSGFAVSKLILIVTLTVLEF